MSYAAYVEQTEQTLRRHESHFPPHGLARDEWAMWLAAEAFPREIDTRIALKAAATDADWLMMKVMRLEIERSFGITDEALVNGFIDDIKRKVLSLGGCWYLAFETGQNSPPPVGEVGLVPFEIDGLRFGRLQDVDIVPARQRRGLGNALLTSVCFEARALGLSGLALKARADGWVKDWYQRFGFERVG